MYIPIFVSGQDWSDSEASTYKDQDSRTRDSFFESVQHFLYKLQPSGAVIKWDSH